MKYPILLAVLLAFLAINTHAQTQVGGGIYNSETWTKANSPYIVSGEVVLFSGAVLTIEPGVEVRFNNKAKIILRGNIKAIGSVGDSIRFTSNAASPAKGDYNGLSSEVNSSYPLGAQVSQIVIEYAIVEYAINFIDFSNSGGNGPYTIKNSRFSNNVNVMKYLAAATRNTKITYANCLFTNNDYGLYGGGESHDVSIKDCRFYNNKRGCEGGYIDRCVFANNTDEAVYLYHSITNSYIFNNKVGARVDMHTNTKFANNQVYNNDIGVEIDRMWHNNPSGIFQDNIICHNTTWNIMYNYTNNVSLVQNCWCSNDSTFIASKIRDGYDDVAYGLIDFSYNRTCTTSPPPPTDVPTTQMIKETISFTLYPNPATDHVNITPSTSLVYDVMVCDINGKMVKLMTNNSGITSIDLSGLSRGNYIVNIVTTEGVSKAQKMTVR